MLFHEIEWNISTIATGSVDKTLKLWNVETGKEIATYIGHKSHIYIASFSPDGKIIASGGTDKTIKLWNVDSREEVFSIEGHKNLVYSIAFSPDGNTLASGSYDKSIKLWNLKTNSKTLKPISPRISARN